MTLITSSEEMDDIMKIVKSGLLIEVVSETIKNEAKDQKGGFFSMLLGPLAATLLRRVLANKGILRAGEGVIRARQDF